MAHINLIASVQKVTKDFHGKPMHLSRYSFSDRILVSIDFIHHFSIDYSSNSFSDYHPTEKASVENLISWIEKQLEQDKKNAPNRKFKTKQIDFAINKFLPKLKKWNKDSLVLVS